MNELIEKVKYLQDKCFETLQNKNKDYAGGQDPYKNFRLVELAEITDMPTGIVVRMMDKMARISRLLHNPAHVKDESIVDTLMDLSNYALILASLYVDKEEE